MMGGFLWQWNNHRPDAIKLLFLDLADLDGILISDWWTWPMVLSHCFSLYIQSFLIMRQRSTVMQC